MKTKLFFLPILALTTVLSVSAQQIESDDMYFTSKDRAKEKASYKASFAANTEIVAKAVKSSDQYSGRSINPEYTTRLNANSNTIQGSTNPYFDSGYSYKSTTRSNFNNNNNPYYGNSFYNSPYSSWGNPYSSNLYGSLGMMYGYSPYSSFYSPLYSPYTSMFSPYDYYMMSMGYGSSFCSPYGYNSMMFGYGMGYSALFYNPYSFYSGYQPYYYYGAGTDYGTTSVAGKRSSRSSVTNSSVVPSSPATVYATTAPDQNDQYYTIPVSDRTSAQQYYQPDWRNNSDLSSGTDSRTSRSQSLGTQNPSLSRGGTRQNQISTWNNTNSRQSQTTWNNTNTNQNSFESQTRSQSISSPSMSAPSSSPSWGGGGSSGGGGGQSRGR